MDNIKKDSVSREFLVESFSRSIDENNDPEELKSLCKRAFNLYLKEFDLSEKSILLCNKLYRQGKYQFPLGLCLGVFVTLVFYFLLGK